MRQINVLLLSATFLSFTLPLQLRAEAPRARTLPKQTVGDLSPSNPCNCSNTSLNYTKTDGKCILSYCSTYVCNYSGEGIVPSNNCSSNNGNWGLTCTTEVDESKCENPVVSAINSRQ
jgi:hypothetical protein